VCVLANDEVRSPVWVRQEACRLQRVASGVIRSERRWRNRRWPEQTDTKNEDATMTVAAPMKTGTREGKGTTPKPLPAPNSDFYGTLKPDELTIVKRVREFMEAKVAPVITKYWCDDSFPFELLPAAKELGVGGIGLKGYGCPGGSIKLLGFVQMEIARTDPSFATFLGVHTGLAMGSIYIDGSEEQKQKWLPPM